MDKIYLLFVYYGDGSEYGEAIFDYGTFLHGVYKTLDDAKCAVSNIIKQLNPNNISSKSIDTDFHYDPDEEINVLEMVYDMDRFNVTFSIKETVFGDIEKNLENVTLWRDLL